MVEAQAISDLYRQPLADFTRARDELVTRLADRGDKDGAKMVKGLRKPTVAAWAVNQLAHENPGDLGELFDLRDRLKGTSDAAELRGASQERRKLVSQLAAAAAKILEGAGHAATAPTLEKISQTLQAGETPEEREMLLEGRLPKELTPSGLEGFPMAALESVDVGEEDTKARLQVERLAAEADAAEREAEALEWTADAARQEARRAERAAAAAARKAAAARQRAEKAAGDLS